MSVDFEAFTTQDEPASPGVSTPPDVTEQVPDTFDHVTAPVPEPPEATRFRASPYVALVDVTVKAAWFALLIVTAVADEAACT